MSDTELHHQTLVQLRTALHSKQVSAHELAQHFLQRIEKHDAQVGAYLSTDADATLAQAKAADVRLAEGAAVEDAPLLGLPIAHKDLFVTASHPTTAASKMLEGYRSPFDATVVENCAKAGMVTLGKVNCDEFAMGSGNENSAYGEARNPWNTEHVPGGSSGGSSAAVAACLAPAASGTDTGGSIRQPAAFCGITGIKPTYGRISRHGMIAYASSLDQAGPMARTAEDCALLLSAMAGADVARDSTSLDLPAEDYSVDLAKPLQGVKIGVPKEYFQHGLDAEIEAHTQAALKVYEQLGATLVDVQLPNTELAVPTYYVLASAEASSNLSRYDGVRYGHRANDYADLNDMYVKSRSEGLGAEVQKRIMLGTYVLSHGYYDAYYVQAQRVRRLIADDFKQAFTQCDMLLAPVSPTPAWKIGANRDDPLANYLADAFTLPASLAGLPCMSHPAGFTSAGLPVGVQLIGNYLQEAKLLNAAHQFQQKTDFHTAIPNGF